MALGAVPVRTREASSAKVVVADMVDLVLDAPVPAHTVRDLGNVGLPRRQVGDRVDTLQSDPAGGDGPAAAHDLHGLGGVGEAEAAGDGAGLDAADLVTAVLRGAGLVQQRNLPPGQALEALVQ
jgi:hypothetical protein